MDRSTRSVRDEDRFLEEFKKALDENMNTLVVASLAMTARNMFKVIANSINTEITEVSVNEFENKVYETLARLLASFGSIKVIAVFRLLDGVALMIINKSGHRSVYAKTSNETYFAYSGSENYVIMTKAPMNIIINVKPTV